MKELYRIKEAFIIFWAVLTHRYYYFASGRHVKGKPYGKDVKAGCNFTSTPAEEHPIFLELAGEFAMKFKEKYKKR